VPPSAWPLVLFAGLVSAGAIGALVRMKQAEDYEMGALR
jgi:hypothetical protein